MISGQRYIQVLKRNRTYSVCVCVCAHLYIYICVCAGLRENYFKNLTHLIMESDKSQNLQGGLVGWQHREELILLFKFEGGLLSKFPLPRVG